MADPCSICNEFALSFCKQVNISKSGNGSIRLNVTLLFIKSELDIKGLVNTEIDDKVTYWGYTFICVSRDVDGINVKLSLINEASYEEKKLLNTVIFRTVPTTLWDAAKLSIINNLIIPTIDNPDVELQTIHDSTVTPYGNGGWTNKSILETLASDYFSSNIYIPSDFEYDIVELSVNTGTTLIQIVQNLLPIPGLVAHYNYNGDIEINPAPSSSEFDSFCESLEPCIKTSLGGSVKEFYYIVEGLQAYPLGIDATQLYTIQYISSETYQGLKSSDNIPLIWNLGIIYNIFGSIYGISSMSQSSECFETHIILPDDKAELNLSKLPFV